MGGVSEDEEQEWPSCRLLFQWPACVGMCLSARLRAPARPCPVAPTLPTAAPPGRPGMCACHHGRGTLLPRARVPTYCSIKRKRTRQPALPPPGLDPDDARALLPSVPSSEQPSTGWGGNGKRCGCGCRTATGRGTSTTRPPCPVPCAILAATPCSLRSSVRQHAPCERASRSCGGARPTRTAWVARAAPCCLRSRGPRILLPARLHGRVRASAGRAARTARAHRTGVMKRNGRGAELRMAMDSAVRGMGLCRTDAATGAAWARPCPRVRIRGRGGADAAAKAVVVARGGEQRT